MNLQLDMGALCPPIADQLEAQGLRYRAGQDAKAWQRDADAVTRCTIRDLIPDSVASKARRKLIDRIAKQVERAEASESDERKASHESA